MMAYFLVRELDILSGDSMLDSVIDGKKSGNVLNELETKVWFDFLQDAFTHFA